MLSAYVYLSIRGKKNSERSIHSVKKISMKHFFFNAKECFGNIYFLVFLLISLLNNHEIKKK